jgi:hypothetical protein
MAQLFHRSTNVLSKVSIFGSVFFVAGALWIFAAFDRSHYNTGAYVTHAQPVQFSHKHHVGDDGIDCRYCHTSVETSSFAGIPPTATCMNCHSWLFADSPYLEPVRESLRSGKPIPWLRVHDLPGFVYFDHSIHVNKGIGCADCHGRVDQMPLTHRVASLQMEWCLACHRDPTARLRPPDEIFDMAWVPPPDQEARGRELAEFYHTPDERLLTSCSTCHR